MQKQIEILHIVDYNYCTDFPLHNNLIDSTCTCGESIALSPLSPTESTNTLIAAAVLNK